MRNTGYPIPMTIVELWDCVAEYPQFDGAVRQELLGADEISPLSPDLQRRMLGQMSLSSEGLIAEVEGAAVVVTNDWVVSIYGKDKTHCLASLIKYRNAVATRLGVCVTGVLRTPPSGNTGPPTEWVSRREGQKRMKATLVNLKWAVVSGVVGYVLCLLVGG